MKAVVLAAGEGSRLREGGRREPKPLTLLGGMPLLERVLRTARRAGATELVVVVGHRGEEIEREVAPRVSGLPVRWVHHPDWALGNGSSVLAARPAVGAEPFLCLMADHLLFSSTLAGLLGAPREPGESVLAVDRKASLLVDLADATKVRLREGRVVDVGKALDPFDAVDCGAAVLGPEIFDVLERAAAEAGGRAAHGEGLARLARAGRLQAHDVGADRWEDADTEEALQAAERLLFESLRKPTDGFLSRHLERRLSLALTRRLAKTSITPNHVSLAIVGVGLLAALLFAVPEPAARVAGALVFWCASFLDGCDGELARLKFLESRLGGWLDLWVDNVVHALVFSGMGVGLWRERGESLWLGLAAAAVAGVLLSASFASWKTRRVRRGTGPLFVSVFGELREGRDEAAARPVAARVRRLADALSRRDFVFGVVFVAALGFLDAFLWAAAIGANVYFLVLVTLEVLERRDEAAAGAARRGAEA